MKEIQDVQVAMRAKVGLIWLRTNEEMRVERMMVPIADQMNYELHVWSVTTGLVSCQDYEEIMNSPRSDKANITTADLGAAIKSFLNMPKRVILLMLDPSPWFQDPMTLRAIKDLHRKLPSITKNEAKQVVILDSSEPTRSVPGITVIDWPLPDRDIMAKIVDEFVECAPEKAKKDVATNGHKEALVSAMMGLTSEGAANALSRSLADKGVFDTSLVSLEKRRVVQGSGLEWYEPDERGMDGIGGNDNLKSWLMTRKKAFSKEAREFGLPSPKGCLLLGIPGCGKSLTAKCIAAAWNMPLIKMDVGSLFSKYVGESEDKIRVALKTAETVAPCILWLDEIEKAFSGIGGGESDGGTSSRVFGSFLTWMQDRKDGVFVIATSNDISKLPAEFLRAGRWDDIWFVDLPNDNERKEIAEVMNRKYGKSCQDIDAARVSSVSVSYTGAEIEQAYIDAMYTAFEEGRKVTTDDIANALQRRVPLVKTMQQKIETLREWAKGRARMAGVDKKQSRKPSIVRDIE